MARARNIKPSIMDNEDLADLDPLARLLFIYLWMLADRDGRLEDRPKRIAAQALPYDRTADVDKMLQDLCAGGFIRRYQVGDLAIIQITSFTKHQTPHGTEKDGVLPDESGKYTVNSRGKNGYATGEVVLSDAPLKVSKQCDNSALTVNPPCVNTLIPDSLIPDSGFTDSPIQEELSGEPVADKSAPPNPRGSRLDPDWVLPMGWGQWALAEFPHWTTDIVRVEASKFRDHWLSESGAKARKVDWLATWRKWCRSEIAQKAHSPPQAHKETPYAQHMRERVEQAAGSMAHIVAAKAPGRRPPEPWEVAANEQRTIEANTTGTLAIGLD